MPLIPDAATIQKSLAMLPVSTYEPGEMVIAAGATTGKLLFLRQGEVEVLREGTQIARISEPGSVFGELAVLLDKPHTADVRALERSEFNVADGATLLGSDPAATLYIAAILAGRLDGANRALIEIKRQLETGKPRAAIARTVDRIADLLSSSGANLVYAGYPYNPFALPIRSSVRPRRAQMRTLKALESTSSDVCHRARTRCRCARASAFRDPSG